MSGFRDQIFYDPKHDHGFWSPSTSSANFCEQDYAVSFYVGEFINTISNLAYIYFALYPPTLSLPVLTKHGQKDSLHEGQRQRFIWDVHTIALISIGLCSALFHLTLRSIPQFFDESSMYFLAAGFAFDLATTRYTISDVDSAVVHQHRNLTAAIIFLTVVTTSTISLRTGDLIIHSITFAAALIFSGYKMIKLIRQQDSNRRKKLYRHLFSADMIFNAGFALWLIDCSPAYCAYLHLFRDRLVQALPPGVGVLLGFITELHGWWHVLTARAAGEFISLIRCLTQEAPAYRTGGTKRME